MTNKIEIDNFLSSNMEKDEIDIGKLFRFLLMQSKLILSIVFVVFAISVAYYSFATKKYEIKSLIQYEAFDQNIFDPSQALRFTSPGNSDISNMVQLYESRTNYLKVINDLKLHIDIQDLDDDENIVESIYPEAINEENESDENSTPRAKASH